ncbi:MAG: tRNA (adenosine(37)-N6)-dimethylallyltransferase MiaA [Desulfitobacterium sp.]|nr:tRNA (adenosine(37)-N6)-dimethylallyltransferase MiaA [Desulfitobacterium sp.]
MKPLIIIVGPTAVGKTALGVALARTLQGEIISGDSVQVYKKLDIGSAKPSLEEQGGIRHHLLDFLDPAEPFSVAQFQNLAQKAIQDIQSRGKIPIVVGGTGLYIRSLIDPFDFVETGSETIRQYWTDFYQKHGKEALHTELAKIDPVSAKRLHPNDTVRIVRALEVCQLTGKPYSQVRGKKDTQYPKLPPNILYLGLNAPREIIYERINKRCEIMVEEGLIEEALNIIREGYSPKIKPLQSIGYRHALLYLFGKVTLPEMMRIFQRDTRHFAKRQLTWFRRDPRITWYNTYEEEMKNILESIIDTCSRL